MDIKHTSVKDLHKVVPQDLTEIHKKLQGALGEGNPFAKCQIGGGFYVWTSETGPWQQMIAASSIKQNMVREELLRVRQSVAQKVGTKTAEALFTIPDDSYIYYMDEGDGIKIMLTGWAFKKPVRVTGGPDVSGLNKKNPVSLSFVYDGETLPNYKFGVRLDKQVKTLQTGSDGFFHFEDLKVGEHYILTDIHTNTDHNLDIQQDVSAYTFDVTRHHTFRIVATQQGKPLTGENATLAYRGKNYSSVTDGNGEALIDVAYHADNDFTATMRDVEKQGVISANDETIVPFDFEGQVVPPPEQPEQPQMFYPHILVTNLEGKPLVDRAIEVEYQGNATEYHTDADGMVSLPEMMSGATMKVTDHGGTDAAEEYTLNHQKFEYVFVVPDNDNIKVMVRDYEGNPLSCSSVEFAQEGKPVQRVQLDENGNVFFDRDTFDAGIPINVHIEGNERPCDPFPLIIEEEENEYLLQENTPEEDTGGTPAGLIVLFFIILALVCGLLWFLFCMGAPDLYTLIYR